MKDSRVPDDVLLTWAEQIGSTQVALVARARHGAPPQALATTHQTAGHGRLGRAWVCPPGGGLALSVLLRPKRADGWTWLPLLTGVAVLSAIERLRQASPACRPEPASLGLKWPNDVLEPRGAKLAGLLAELVDLPSVPRACVLGIGVNLRSADAPDGAVGLDSFGVVCPPDDLARALVDEVGTWVARWERDDSAVASAYRDACVTIGEVVRVSLPDGTEVNGTAVAVDAYGRLVVRERGGHEVALSAGDVVHVRQA
jgi:BirA family transcriptional regulator, biotin operon repressor / biotin---[acetyl-CoA-carboxylase] ligase